MKLRHKINHGWAPPASPLHPDPVSVGYEAEVQATLRRAEKAWRKAQKALATAEWRATRRPAPEDHETIRQLRAEVDRRLAELRELESLMQQRPLTTGSNRAGRRKSPRSVTPKGTQL